MAKAVYTEIDWTERKDRFWANFFNTLSGARSSVLIGTSDNSGNYNLAIFNSLVHFGANPPLMGFILRPTTVPRGTYKNIKETGLCTINHVTTDMINQAHQTSAKYEADESEFDAVNLQPELDESGAPFVEKSPIKFLMRFKEEHHLMNDTLLIVGQIEKVILNNEIIEEDGSIKVADEDLIVTSGLYHYHSVNFRVKKDFARPSK